MLHAALLVFTLLHPAPALADGTGSDLVQAVTDTAQVGPLAMRPGDLKATDKGAYVYVMADLFPYRAALKAAGKAGGRAALAVALVRDRFAAEFPKSPFFKVALVEFPERDQYDAPRWDKIQVLGRFKVARKGAGWAASPVKE